MARNGGDSYFVLVNNNDDIYEQEDPITGYTYVLDFDDEDEAKECLDILVADEELDPIDGWHVERHRW